ncbi:SPS-sensor component ptr3 [Pichia californica]|uniref:SPS-sensor component ptr3 n=1 Tax=Pichia californica TaxID=460514 RepID=A0A9P7BHC1_9ASCO|nr:SPS-sensor component ptr3 [[Candida] californica]KAG0689839.1 SPS-sensor component ptr3 [[Candida] californica]
MSASNQSSSISVSDIVRHLELLLSVPISIDYTKYPLSPTCGITNDISTLTCGCLISEAFANSLKSQLHLNPDINNNAATINANQFSCPTCKVSNVQILAPCINMRNMVIYLSKLKQEISTAITTPSSLSDTSHTYNDDHSALSLAQSRSSDKDFDDDLPSMFSKLNIDNFKKTQQGNSQSHLSIGSSSITQQQKQQQQNQQQSNLSFLTAFHEVLVEIQNPSSVESNEISKSPTYSSKSSPHEQYFDESNNSHSNGINTNSNNQSTPLYVAGHSPTNTSVISSLGSIQRQRTRQSSFQNTSNLTKLISSTSSNYTSDLSSINKNYPNKEMLLSKNYPFFRRIYTFNIHNNNFLLKTRVYLQTQLSPNLTKLVLLAEKKWEVYTIDTEKPEKPPKLLCCGKSDGSYGIDVDHMKRVSKEKTIENSNITENIDDALELLSSWEHLYCQITENLLVISGTRGFLRILDLTQNGRCIYTYQCNFPIRCIDVSPNEEFISLGITGKDKYTQVEQAVIIIIKLIPETSRNPFQVVTFPFSLPYRDPICILKFSSDSTLLSVATALESRFLIISLVDPSRPTLVMKSQRRLDTSLDSEGITDMSFFPDSRLMTITSLSHNSEPIIIDTNISSISGPDGIAKPKLLMKIDEVGSTIHKCCVSPRGDSVAYLNRNGNVYIMATPRMDDNDNKKISCVLEVANAFRAKEAASLKFDSDGYKLYVLDRKGVLSIADFTAGSVEDHSVTRCKIIT